MFGKTLTGAHLVHSDGGFLTAGNLSPSLGYKDVNLPFRKPKKEIKFSSKQVSLFYPVKK